MQDNYPKCLLHPGVSVTKYCRTSHTLLCHVCEEGSDGDSEGLAPLPLARIRQYGHSEKEIKMAIEDLKAELARCTQALVFIQIANSGVKRRRKNKGKTGSSSKAVRERKGVERAEPIQETGSRVDPIQERVEKIELKNPFLPSIIMCMNCAVPATCFCQTCNKDYCTTCRTADKGHSFLDFDQDALSPLVASSSSPSSSPSSSSSSSSSDRNAATPPTPRAAWGAVSHSFDPAPPPPSVTSLDPPEKRNCVGVKGTFQRTWGKYGDGKTGLKEPTGIAVYGGKVYVVDSYNQRVVVLSHSDWLMTNQLGIGSRGSAPGQFNNPCAIAINEKRKEILVADTSNHRIQVFDLNTHDFVTQFGRVSQEHMCLNSPYGIVSRDDRVFVSDTFNHRIQVFDMRSARKSIEVWKSKGDKKGEDSLNFPRGLELLDDELFVVDGFNDRVVCYDTRNFGKTTRVIGQDLLRRPFDVAIRGHEMLVTNTSDHTIHVLDHTYKAGKWLRKWGSQGFGEGEFTNPWGVACSDEHIFVTDSKNNRIQMFS